jgi:hypothetical protein
MRVPHIPWDGDPMQDGDPMHDIHPMQDVDEADPIRVEIQGPYTATTDHLEVTTDATETSPLGKCSHSTLMLSTVSHRSSIMVTRSIQCINLAHPVLSDSCEPEWR